jgi:hypothetical protein
VFQHVAGANFVSVDLWHVNKPLRKVDDVLSGSISGAVWCCNRTLIMLHLHRELRWVHGGYAK